MKQHTFNGRNYTEADVKAQVAEWARRGYEATYEIDGSQSSIRVMLPDEMEIAEAYRLSFDVTATATPDDEPYGDDDED